jgi:hypothetical protein
MARRRFQNPKPFREGNWWWMNVWQDEINEGRLTRKRKRVKVCPATTPEHEAREIASEMLRPMNQGLQTVGSATRFAQYVDSTYRPVVLPLLASTTKASYEGTLEKYLKPVFWKHSTAGHEHAEFAGVFFQIGYFYIERSHGS